NLFKVGDEDGLAAGRSTRTKPATLVERYLEVAKAPFDVFTRAYYPAAGQDAAVPVGQEQQCPAVAELPDDYVERKLHYLFHVQCRIDQQARLVQRRLCIQALRLDAGHPRKGAAHVIEGFGENA